MAWGRKKGGRKEPRFGPGASLGALRLSPEDRIGGSDEEKPKKKSAKRKVVENDDDELPPPPPRERKPRDGKSVSKRRSRTFLPFSISRLMYWCVVLGLWGAIAVVAAVVWAGAHLPAIQSLEIPKRPPTIEIVGIDG